MERLTGWDNERAYICNLQPLEMESGPSNLIRAVVERLAAYEDTGLAPEEVSGILDGCRGIGKQDWMVTLFGEPLGEWYQIAKAKEEGRLVILPQKTVFVPTWDAGPDCDLVCPVEIDGVGCCSLCEKAEVYVYERPCRQEHLDLLGKRVFATREEAEAFAEKMR